MIPSCCNGDNVSPTGHVALTILIVTHRHDRAVCFQTNGVPPSCCNGDNVSPAGHIALTIIIPSHCRDRAVCFQTNGVHPSCCNGDNVSPAGHITLTPRIAAHRHDPSVCFQPDGVHQSCCKRFSCSNCVPQFEAALPRVLIFSNFRKCNGGFCGLSLRQQLFSLRIFLRICRLYTHSRRILVIAQCLKCCDCTVIIAGSQQLFGFRILDSRNGNLCDEHGQQKQRGQAACDSGRNSQATVLLLLLFCGGVRRFFRIKDRLRPVRFGCIGFRAELAREDALCVGFCTKIALRNATWGASRLGCSAAAHPSRRMRGSIRFFVHRQLIAAGIDDPGVRLRI